MNQLSFDLKFPWEREQICLDLDFTPCEEYQRDLWLKRNAEGWATQLNVTNGGQVTWSQTNSVVALRPSNTSAGYWQIGESYQIYNKTRPNWFHQKMAKFFFGMTWVDK